MSDLKLRAAVSEFREDITLRDMLTPLFRRKQLIVVTFALLILISVLAAVGASHKYESNMEILVNRERSDPLVTPEATNQVVTQPSAVTEEEINSEAELLRSQDVLEKVVLANGLEKKEQRPSWMHLPKRDPAECVSLAVKHLGKKLDIDTPTKTNLISVKYTSANPQTAYGVLSTLATLYVEKHVEVHRPSGSYEFFAKEADKYRNALEDSEARLANFGKDQGVVAPDVQRTDIALVLANTVGSLHQAEQAAAADESRVRDDNDQMRKIPERSPTQQVSNDASILLQQLQSSLLAAQLKRTQLLVKFQPSYPLVQEADREIADTQAAIAEAQKTQYVDQTTDRDPTFELLREDAAKAQADLAAQHASVVAWKSSIQNMQLKMVGLDQEALKQADLLRETKENEDNYLLYVSKREQERTADALDKKRIANVAIAVPPVIPALPATSPIRIAMIGFLAAIAISLGLGYTVDFLDSSFRNPGEVIKTLGIPVVISLPKHMALLNDGPKLLPTRQAPLL